MCSTGRVKLGPGRQDSPRRGSFGLLATRRVGFLLPQLSLRLIGELPMSHQGPYLLGIFLSLPLLPCSTYWLYWTYSHSLFWFVATSHAFLPSVTDYFYLSRIIFNCYGLLAPLVYYLLPCNYLSSPFSTLLTPFSTLSELSGTRYTMCEASCIIVLVMDPHCLSRTDFATSRLLISIFVTNWHLAHCTDSGTLKQSLNVDLPALYKG